MRVTLWTTNNGQLPANLAFKNNYAATTNPGVTDDASEGYEVGSVWINTTADTGWLCTDSTAGAAVWKESAQTAGQLIAPDATGATGNGGTATVRGGGGGTTSGAGGSANLTGGAAMAGDSNGGSVNLNPGAASGAGIIGAVRTTGLAVKTQAAPVAKTVSVTLTPAELKNGIITGNQGAAGAAAYTLPLATDMDAAMWRNVAADDSFDFSIINLSAVDAEDITLTANTGFTIVGNAVIEAASATTKTSWARFRVRRVAVSTFVAYRIG